MWYSAVSSVCFEIYQGYGIRRSALWVYLALNLPNSMRTYSKSNLFRAGSGDRAGVANRESSLSKLCWLFTNHQEESQHLLSVLGAVEGSIFQKLICTWNENYSAPDFETVISWSRRLKTPWQLDRENENGTSVHMILEYRPCYSNWPASVRLGRWTKQVTIYSFK